VGISYTRGTMTWYCFDVWMPERLSKCWWRYMRDPLEHMPMDMPWPEKF